MTIGYEDALGLLFIISILVLLFLGPGWLLSTRKLSDDGDSDSDDPPGGDDYGGPSFSVTPLSKDIKMYECGHEGPLNFTFKVYGVESGPVVDAEPCPDCFKKEFLPLVARCARCGKGIFPSEPVAVYHISNLGLRLKTANYSDDTHVIGCMDMNCCPSGGFFAGHWTGKNFKPHFVGGHTAVEEVFKTGTPVHVETVL